MEIKVPDDLLKKITAAAQRQIELEQKLDDLDEQKKATGQELAMIAGGWVYEDGKGHAVDGQIPQLMQEASIEKLVLNGGMILEIATEIKPPSMAADAPNREKVLKFCEDSGNSGVIKDLITIPFDKGDIKVKALLEFLKMTSINFDRFRSIHPATLKKLLTELLEEGKEVPMADLDVQKYDRSKIKMPKEKK